MQQLYENHTSVYTNTLYQLYNFCFFSLYLLTFFFLTDFPNRATLTDTCAYMLPTAMAATYWHDKKHVVAEVFNSIIPTLPTTRITIISMLLTATHIITTTIPIIMLLQRLQQRPLQHTHIHSMPVTMAIILIIIITRTIRIIHRRRTIITITALANMLPRPVHKTIQGIIYVQH